MVNRGLRDRLDWRVLAALLASAAIIAGAVEVAPHLIHQSAPRNVADSAMLNNQCPADPHKSSCGSPPPASKLLNTNNADQIEEPATPGPGSNISVDPHLWQFCGAGAATVALSYWIDVFHHATSQPFTHPGLNPVTYNDGTFTNNHGQAYLMYVATQSKPPSFGSAGLVSFDVNDPTQTSANAEDTRDVLNWEASGHSSDWQNYWYTISYVANNAQNLRDHSPDADPHNPNAQVAENVIKTRLESDIAVGHPVIAQVNDGNLPDWAQSNAKGHGHLIAIIGYDNTATIPTYTYVETCTSQACGTVQTDGPNPDGSGTHTIPQSELYQAMQEFPGEGALIW